MMLNPFRRWQRNSLANAIALHASLIAIAAALLVAAISLVVLYQTQDTALNNQMEEKVTRLAERMERTISVAEHTVEDLSRSAMFTTAIMDSAGLNTFVQPFLRNYKLPIPVASAIALCDINRAYLAGTNSEILGCSADLPLFQQVLSDGKPARVLVTLANGHLAWRVYLGVVFVYTGTVEGVTVMQLDLNELLSPIPRDLELQSASLLHLGNGQQLISAGERGREPELMYTAERALFLGDSGGSPMPLAVKIWKKATPLGNLLRPLMIGYGLGVLLLLLVVVVGTWRVARRLIAPLVNLIGITGEISDSGNMHIIIPSGRYGELRQLSNAFKRMVDTIRASEEQLEAQVIARTEQLAKKEEQFRTLVENIPGTTFRALMDEQRSLLFVSQGVEQLLDFPVARFTTHSTARGLMSVVHPDDAALLRQCISHAVEGGAHYTCEYRVIDQAGIIRDVHEKGQVIFDADGTALYADGFMQDVTRRKRNALLLEEKARQLREITDCAPVMLAEIDAAKYYRFVNDYYAEIFGLSPQDLVGQQVWKIMGVEQFAHAEPYLNAALSGDDAMYDLEQPTVAGQPHRVLSVHYSPEYDATNRVVGVIAAISDVTERRRAEDALKEKVEEMARFQRLTVGRELDMLALKQEVNTLHQQLGKTIKYSAPDDVLKRDFDA